MKRFLSQLATVTLGIFIGALFFGVPGVKGGGEPVATQNGDIDGDGSRNITDAGVESSIAIVHGDFRELTLQRVASLAKRRNPDLRTGLILSNPPYGKRLDDAFLLQLYRDLREFCGGFPNWRAGFFVDNPAFESCFRMRPISKKPLSNGPLRGYFYLYQL